MGVGGPISDFREAASTEELIETSVDVWQSGEPWIVCGGGSNLVVADDGFDGVVIAPRSNGIRVVDERGARVVVEVDAGVEWDSLVEQAVANNWGGIEALSGIPGRVGAAPIQNIGAYGNEFADIAVSIRFLDEGATESVPIAAAACGFAYRASVFKAGRAGVVTSVTIDLDAGGYSAPIAYGQLADRLGVPLGSRIPGVDVRAAVLELRRSKGMVFDPVDADTHGCGSFFVNPIVAAETLATLPLGVPYWPSAPASPSERPTIISLDNLGQVDLPGPATTVAAPVKLSAAWLIERAGIRRGFCLPGSNAAVSSKHTLAITNRGGCSADDVVELARYIQTRVASEFGVVLQPEPQLIGVGI